MVEEEVNKRLAAPNTNRSLRIDTTLASSIGNLHPNIEISTSDLVNNNGFLSNSSEISQDYNDHNFATFVGPLYTVSSQSIHVNDSNPSSYLNHSERLSEMPPIIDQFRQTFYLETNDQYKNTLPPTTVPTLSSSSPNDIEGKNMITATQNSFELGISEPNFDNRNCQTVQTSELNSGQFTVLGELPNNERSMCPNFNIHVFNNSGNNLLGKETSQFHTNDLIMNSNSLESQTLPEHFFHSTDNQTTELSNTESINPFYIDLSEPSNMQMNSFNNDTNILVSEEYERRNSLDISSITQMSFPLPGNNNFKGHGLGHNQFSSDIDKILSFDSFEQPNNIMEGGDSLYISVGQSEHESQIPLQEGEFEKLNGMNNNEIIFTSIEQQLLFKQIKSPRKKPYINQRKSSMGSTISTPGTATTSPSLSSKEGSSADLRGGLSSSSSVDLKFENVLNTPNQYQPLFLKLGSDKDINGTLTQASTSSSAEVLHVTKTKGEYQRQENKGYMNCESKSLQPQIGLLNFRKPNAWKRSKGGAASGNDKDTKSNSKAGESKGRRQQDTPEVKSESSITP
ncbi:hypothetical protein NADFUDRAFT_40851 [Nadsonia fulvescens var. elongata DSM 6958]|uniref:Uncharacterized protein n=1 Tax=Nadsonia fulvescens var. elongata DSM 6958 TaxID=857566 RepID=A0A1E3PL95_9ASCO|nr:hypothetical protein NADFUDRAFT_40851 [Nadsonia fulvescens var. elongata DSM 6958]